MRRRLHQQREREWLSLFAHYAVRRGFFKSQHSLVERVLGLLRLRNDN